MTCGPFTAALDPQSSNGPERRTKEGESGSSVCLWDGSRFRLLSHLFRSEASQMWARGTAQGQQPYVYFYTGVLQILPLVSTHQINTNLN